MSKSSITRRRRVRKAQRMCRAICKANNLAGYVMDERDKILCGPRNCDVYRAMVRGEMKPLG
jgi:hypothetical protein